MSDENDRVSEWWTRTTQEDWERALVKAQEYGSSDLRWMGQAFLDVIGWKDAPEGAGIELACILYLYGKAARALGAFQSHELPSSDTLQDAKLYATMCAYVREFKQWP